jgi:hypothetical protein
VEIAYERLKCFLKIHFMSPCPKEEYIDSFGSNYFDFLIIIKKLYIISIVMNG